MAIGMVSLIHCLIGASSSAIWRSPGKIYCRHSFLNRSDYGK
jgi:hypothetical protein